MLSYACNDEAALFFVVVAHGGNQRRINGVVSKNTKYNNVWFGGIKAALLIRPGLIRPGLCSPKLLL